MHNKNKKRNSKKMKKFFIVAGETFVDCLYTLQLFIEDNLRNFTLILRFILPYLMLFIGNKVYEQRNGFAIGGEIFIPIIAFLLIYYINKFTNKIGKGNKTPIPNERFTSKGEEEGEVVFNTDREEELILYVYNLENYLERKGLLKSNNK